MTQAEAPGFGSPRFEIRRRLGSGAMGVVFEAYDTERRLPVALKRLHETDAVALSQLKREFRALTDIGHPNLVTLYELFANEASGFFTMELVDGVPFLEHVRGAAAQRLPSTTSSDSADATFSVSESIGDADDTTTGETEGVVLSEGRGELASDLDRLRDAFRQLAEAVAALHRADRLHRDLKPSNVLVDHDRVVVLDFGLATGVGTGGSGTVVGTAAYMAPEQAAGRPVSTASDWYAFGSMLFEALTGLRPFVGPVARILADKQRFDAPVLHEVCDGIPDDLSRLCTALLSRSPADRPDADAVLAVLGSKARGTSAGTVLVGREAETAALKAAWTLARTGGSVLAVVRGRSGVGKSALVESFLAGIREGVVLGGRCYERESVPFKAIDSLVDALAGVLSRRSPIEVPDLGLLAELFPVLRRVTWVAPLTARPVPDAIERRLVAFAALAALIEALAPALVWLDDVQWGDADSVPAIATLLASDARILIVLTWRAEDDDAPFVHALAPAIEARGTAVTRIEVGELSLAAAGELARRLRPEATDDDITSIAIESGGSPMFVQELASGVMRHSRGGLDDAIRARAAELPARARRALELVAVAGRPIDDALLSEACGTGDVLADLALLRSGRLVRTSGRTAEPFHDRIREAVLASLHPAAVRDHHRSLGDALEKQTDPDPEPIAVHLAAAGERTRAAPYAVLAAERSARGLAFDNAARLYALAVELTADGPREPRRKLQEALGEALTYAGRGNEAADAWLAAAVGAPDSAAIELRRRAAEQALLCGQVDRGLELLDRALQDAGLWRAPDGYPVLASVAARQAWTKIRGLGWQRRTTPLDELTRRRLDVCWSALTGFAFIDQMQAADFQARHLHLALASGEPLRVARSLVAEAAIAGLTGKVAEARELMVQAKPLIEETADPELDALGVMVEAYIAYSGQEFERAITVAEEAERRFVTRCSHVPWQVARTRVFRTWLLPWLGRYREMVPLVDRIHRDAHERGNLWLVASNLAEAGFVAWMVRDDADTCLEQLEAAQARWSTKGFHSQHFNFAIARCCVASYRHEPLEAARQMEEMWPRFARSVFRSLPNIEAVMALYRGRAAAAAVPYAREKAPLKAAARASIAILEKNGSRAGGSHAQVITAILADGELDSDAAEAAWRRAANGFAPLGFKSQHQLARRRLGLSLGGDEGAAMVREADAWLASEGVVRPDLFADANFGVRPPG